MTLQKIRIVSDLLGYGPWPEPEEPSEQRLTVSASGKVWFTEKLFGTFEGGSTTGRKLQLSIGKEQAASILSKIAEYLEEGPIIPFATDIGMWEMSATAADGSIHRMSGSMCGLDFHGENLSAYIRKRVPIDSLAVFGVYGVDEED